MCKLENRKKLLISWLRFYFVRTKGLEPISLAALVPKTSAYTNSATSALNWWAAKIGILSKWRMQS